MSKKAKNQTKFNPNDVEVVAKSNEDLQIRNVEAYKRYEKLSKHPILTTMKMMKASDGQRYNLATVHTYLLPKIAHLPQEEQDKIMAAKKVYYKVAMSRNSELKKAYGTNVKMVAGLNNEAAKIEKVVISNPLTIVQDEVIELFGRMFSIAEVHEIILTKYTKRHPALKNVTMNHLKGFRVNNSVAIQDKIEAFKREYTDMRLSIKRGRLEELVWMYQYRKRVYETSGKGEDHRILLQTLEQIRKEAEGDTLRIEGGIEINTELLITNHIDKEIMSNLNIKEIVLARISSRSHVPVRMFLGQLAKSWYNPVFDETVDIEHEEIKSPSNQSYDFDKIERMQKQLEENKQAQIAEQSKSTFTGEELEKAKSLKEILLEKMAMKRGDILQAKNTLTQNATFDHG